MKMAETRTKGEMFVEELLSGEFKKNRRPNHGQKFTGGLEGLHQYFFDKYLSSCGCFLMDMRKKRSEYRG